MRILNDINKLKNELSSLRPLNQGELKRLRADFAIENTYDSNAIEGNTLTLRETALILQEGVTIDQKPLKDHLEVKGYKDAFDYMVQLVSDQEPLTERIIREIHSLVLVNDKDNKGVFRSVPVTIAGSTDKLSEPENIRDDIISLIKEYKQWQSEKHPVEAISLFHLRFEKDGNGRTGRLLLNFELMKSGLLPVNIKFTDKRKYYDAFKDYSETGTSNAMTELIAQYETSELNRYIQIIEKKERANKSKDER